MPTMFVKFLFFVRLKADLSDPILKRMRVPIFGLEELPILAKEKNNEEQIKMCFSAYYDKNWQVLFD